MYQQAAYLYFDLWVSVGGVDKNDRGKIHGKGCLLNDSYVITAGHIWSGIQRRYHLPAILKYDGMFRATIEAEFPGLDLMILRTTDKIKDASLNRPSSFPVLHPSFPRLGTSVGFLSNVEIGGNRRYVFSSASVAFIDRDPIRVLLTGGMLQPGSSGSPVFTPNSDLIGINVGTWQFPLASKHPLPVFETLPLVSPVYSLRDEIGTLIEQG